MLSESARVADAMTWADLKADLLHVAPFLGAALDCTGPAGMLIGGLIQAATGGSTPEEAKTLLAARDPQVLERIRLAEIQNHGAIQRALIENANLQASTNVASAEHPWLIGWRSLVGYACAAAVAWQLFLLPLVEFFLGLAKITAPVPAFPFSTLMSLLLTLLGAASWHVADRLTGQIPT